MATQNEMQFTVLMNYRSNGSGAAIAEIDALDRSIRRLHPEILATGMNAAVQNLLGQLKRLGVAARTSSREANLIRNAFTSSFMTATNSGIAFSDSVTLATKTAEDAMKDLVVDANQSSGGVSGALRGLQLNLNSLANAFMSAMGVSSETYASQLQNISRLHDLTSGSVMRTTNYLRSYDNELTRQSLITDRAARANETLRVSFADETTLEAIRQEYAGIATNINNMRAALAALNGQNTVDAAMRQRVLHDLIAERQAFNQARAARRAAAATGPTLLRSLIQPPAPPTFPREHTTALDRVRRVPIPMPFDTSGLGEITSMAQRLRATTQYAIHEDLIRRIAAANARARALAGVLGTLMRTTRAVGQTFQFFGKTLGAVAKTLTNTSHAATTASAAFRRMYSTMRAVIFTALIFYTVFVKWFELASGFAEVNHMLYTVSASLYKGAESVKLLSDGTIEFADASKKALAGTEEDLQHIVKATDMFGNTLEDALYYDDTASAQAFQSTIDYLDEIAYKMELDPTKLKQTYAQFLGMAQSAGIAASNANALALSMTELTYDLASLWDVPFETAAQRMRSALAGITRAVQQFGLDVSKASMDAWLLEHGITANYNSLSRADKMMAIYLKMMENTDAAQGDLARSALQPANMFRFLQEQVTLAARQLGAALFPVLTAIIPLFIHAAQAVQIFAARIASWLGIHLGGWYQDAVAQWNSYLSNLGSGFNDQPWMEELGEDLDDTTEGFENASGAAKDFKKQLLGFDEINNLTETKDTGSGLSGGVGAPIDWASMFDMTDIWSKWDGDVRTQIDQAAADIKSALKEAFDLKFGEGQWDYIVAWARVLKKALFDCSEEGDRMRRILGEQFGIEVQPIQEHFKQTLENIKDILGINNGTVGEFVQGFVLGFANITSILQQVIDRLVQIGDGIRNTFNIELDTEKVGFFVGALAGLVPIMGALSPVFKMLSGLATNLGPLVNVVKGISGPVLLIGTILVEAFANSERLRDSIMPFLESLFNLLTTLGETIGIILDLLSPLFGWIGDGLAGLIEGLTWISDKLTWFFDILNTNLENLDIGGWLADKWAATENWWNDVKSWWGETKEKIKSAGETIGRIVFGPIYAIADGVKWLLGLIGIETKTAFADEISDTEEGTNSINGVVEGLRTKISSGVETFFHDLIFVTIPQKLSSLWNEFNTELGGWPAKVLSIGSNIVTGIWNGISGAWQWLKDRVTGLFGGLVSSIKQKLGIASPSKVFAEMGNWSMEGFGIGFDDEYTTTLNRMITTTDNIVQAVTQEVIGIPDLTKAQTNALAGVVGTSVALQANAALQTQSNDLLTASQTEIGLLREQNSLLGQLLEKEFGVSLDGNMLAASINKASRVQGRPLVWA